jgi:putative flippase GtrA
VSRDSHGDRDPTPSAAAKLAVDLTRRAVAGLGSVAVEGIAFVTLVYALGLSPLVAHGVSRPLGGLACWWFNRRYTFRSSGAVPGELLRFAVVFTVSFALSAAWLALFCGPAGLPPLIGKALAEGITFFFNIFALKHFTYRGKQSS